MVPPRDTQALRGPNIPEAQLRLGGFTPADPRYRKPSGSKRRDLGTPRETPGEYRPRKKGQHWETIPKTCIECESLSLEGESLGGV